MTQSKITAANQCRSTNQRHTFVTAPKTMGCEGCWFYQLTKDTSPEPENASGLVADCTDPVIGPNGESLGKILTGRGCDNHIFKLARMVELVPQTLPKAIE